MTWCDDLYRKRETNNPPTNTDVAMIPMSSATFNTNFNGTLDSAYQQSNNEDTGDNTYCTLRQPLPPVPDATAKADGDSIDYEPTDTYDSIEDVPDSSSEDPHAYEIPCETAPVSQPAEE